MKRSAGFVALECQKYQKTHASLLYIWDSWSELLPAIIEAYHSSIPMIIITADRPAHLQQVGASQTIQQKNLFGSHVLDFIQLQEVNTNEKEDLFKCPGRIFVQFSWPNRVDLFI